MKKAIAIIVFGLLLNTNAQAKHKTFDYPFLHWNTFEADEYLKLLKVFKTYEIEIVNGSNFNSKKYFDITKNSWKLNKLSESIQKIKDDCRELSDPNEKTVS